MAEYIERDTLMTALHSGNIDLGFVYKETYRKLREYSREVDKVIKSIPAADVAPVRKGKWIEHGEPDEWKKYQAWYWKCSECGEVGIDEMNYCPHCGAKMEQ